MWQGEEIRFFDSKSRKAEEKAAAGQGMKLVMSRLQFSDVIRDFRQRTVPSQLDIRAELYRSVISRLCILIGHWGWLAPDMID